MQLPWERVCASMVHHMLTFALRAVISSLVRVWQGRFKLTGRVIPTKNQFVTMKCGQRGGSVAMVDRFKKVLAFTEVAWVGHKHDNPSEKPLPTIPKSLLRVRNFFCRGCSLSPFTITSLIGRSNSSKSPRQSQQQPR